jgi:outer membrane protein OmpA-like peptidoglycan-associated protein
MRITSYISFFFLLLLSNYALAQHEVFYNAEVHITYVPGKIKGINSEWAEFCPLLVNDKLVFVSDRESDYLTWGENQWKKKKYLSVFAASIDKNYGDSLSFDGAHSYNEKLLFTNHTGPIAISPDGSMIVFTQVPKQKGKENRPQLYFMQRDGKSWSKPTRIPFCEMQFSFGHPAFSSDGKQLYFASDKAGGYGGKDIYYCSVNNAEFGNPINPGTTINSNADEVFPHFANKYLYFSSNGHQSSGGLDLFRAFVGDTVFHSAQTLGNTINSPGDDFGISFTRDMNHAFFSSNREGGKGNDDIYFSKVVETVTIESKDLAGKFTYRNLNDAATGLEVLLMDENDSIVLRARTNEKGEFAFRQLPAAENFTIKVVSDNPDLRLEIINKDGVAVAVMRSDKDGSFIYKKLDAAQSGTLGLMEEETTELGTRGRISGQFVFEHLANSYPDSLEVMLVDEQGNVFLKTRTDEKGNFYFRNLPLNQSFILKTDETTDDMVLLVFDKSENVKAELRRNEKGEYVYRKLREEALSNLHLIDVTDSTSLEKNTITLSGQFHFRALNQEAGGLNFVILDEDGKIIYKGKTDEKGFFRVRSLASSEQYIFQIDPNDPNFGQMLTLDLFNRKGRSMVILENDKMGRFVYKRLKQEDFYLQQIQEDNVAFVPKFGNVYFHKNEWTILPEGKANLDALVKQLKKNPKLKVELNAYCDSRADESFNLNLSQKRAGAVKNYLTSHGISANRIKATGHGESGIINNCGEGVECPEDQHQVNRRCEIRLLDN